VAIGFFLLPSGCAPSRSMQAAVESQTISSVSSVVLPNAHTFSLSAPGTGGTYRIFVALPDSYPSTRKQYPVLYTVDADAGFALFTQAYRLLRVDPSTPELLLVGVGYEGTVSERRARRLNDLTPTRTGTNPGTGGSGEFLTFLAGTLIPYMDSSYRTIPDDRGLQGHSLGGLFVLYTLLHRPDLFGRYIASSPSLWWDEAVLLRQESLFAQRHRSLPKSVFLSVGSEEPEDMLMYFGPFADSLRSRRYAELELDATVLPGENHLSVVARAFVTGVRSVYGSGTPR
jgi:predicted alpha/beta superfamily hydrolase